jgi:hypothetical protein
MVAKGSELVLFLTEADDKPLASAGTKNARAIVQDGGKTATVQLQPAEPNKLVGAWPSRSGWAPAWSSRPPWRTATPSGPLRQQLTFPESRKEMAMMHNKHVPGTAQAMLRASKSCRYP